MNKLSYKHANTVLENATVMVALKKMKEEDCNSLCVLSEKGKLVGIITLQDIAGATVPPEFVENSSMSDAMFKPGFFSEQSRALADKPIKKIMRTQFVTVTPESHIMTITADFLNNDLYNVPVLKEGHLVGVLTRTDIRDALYAAMDTSS